MACHGLCYLSFLSCASITQAFKILCHHCSYKTLGFCHNRSDHHLHHPQLAWPPIEIGNLWKINPQENTTDFPPTFLQTRAETPADIHTWPFLSTVALSPMHLLLQGFCPPGFTSHDFSALLPPQNLQNYSFSLTKLGHPWASTITI
jgi:hypothetical protein